jgi:hypothetical protein
MRHFVCIIFDSHYLVHWFVCMKAGEWDLRYWMSVFHKMLLLVQEICSSFPSIWLSSQDGILWSTYCKSYLFSPARDGQRQNNSSSWRYTRDGLCSFSFHIMLLPLFPLEDLKIYVHMLCNG